MSSRYVYHHPHPQAVPRRNIPQEGTLSGFYYYIQLKTNLGSGIPEIPHPVSVDRSAASRDSLRVTVRVMVHMPGGHLPARAVGWLPARPNARSSPKLFGGGRRGGQNGTFFHACATTCVGAPTITPL